VVARRRPPEQLVAEHEPRLAGLEGERPVGQLVECRLVEAMRARLGVDALRVQLHIDRIRAGLAGVELPPDLREAVVVLPAAERARTVARRERGRLVEEEELRELPRLEERSALPALELEPAGDPTPDRVAPPDLPVAVVQAAPVPVHEAAGGMRDQLAERRDPVPERH
jgi:hypothetical protein